MIPPTGRGWANRHGTLGRVPHLEIKRQMGRGDIRAVSELLEVAARADGHRPLGEHQWLDLVAGGHEGFAGLVAWEPGHSHPVGYAQVSHEDRNGTWALELVVDPHHRDRQPEIAPRLLQAALEVVRAEGGGPLQYWVARPGPEHDRMATEAGLSHDRDLHQMRRALPAGLEPKVKVRPFRVGQDEQAWLVLNNRAFAGHDEQGAWTSQTLADRMAQPWFDPGGLLIHEVDGAMAAFCWTKVHTHTDHDHDPGTAHGGPLGEIYVIGVDPAHQGRGLGRDMVSVGLVHLEQLGLPAAMLYVDAGNRVAVGLYESMGFTVDHVDRCYATRV